MSDLQKYKKHRMKTNKSFWSGYDERFENFKLGVLLKQARLDAGMTQEQIALQLLQLIFGHPVGRQHAEASVDSVVRSAVGQGLLESPA